MAANQVVYDGDGRGIHRQIAERAMNFAQLHHHELGWFDTGNLLDGAREVAIVQLALGAALHRELTADVFLRFIE